MHLCYLYQQQDHIDHNDQMNEEEQIQMNEMKYVKKMKLNQMVEQYYLYRLILQK